MALLNARRADFAAPRAEATGNLDLRIQCMATRIEHGADGRVNGVVYRDAQGKEQRQKARIVCVAGNAIETLVT